jgi:hypothetical protein
LLDQKATPSKSWWVEKCLCSVDVHYQFGSDC